MLTALLLLTTLLLALSGLALMVLENAYSAFKTEYDSLLEEAAQDDATIDQLTTENDEIRAQAYNRQQELLSALSDAETAADDNEWLYNDANNDLHEACRELEKLQDEHKAYVEGTSEFTAKQARKIAELNLVIERLQTDIEDLYGDLAKKENRISDLKASLNRTIDYWNIAASENREARNELAAVKEELAETKALADNLMSDRIEAIAHMKEQNKKIAELELKEFFDSCEDLDEAIEAAAPQQDIIHLDDNKAWTAIGNWTRLIVYKSSPYHAFIQRGINGPIKRLAAADRTEAQAKRFKDLKEVLRVSKH